MLYFVISPNLFRWRNKLMDGLKYFVNFVCLILNLHPRFSTRPQTFRPHWMYFLMPLFLLIRRNALSHSCLSVSHNPPCLTVLREEWNINEWVLNLGKINTNKVQVNSAGTVLSPSLPSRHTAHMHTHTHTHTHTHWSSLERHLTLFACKLSAGWAATEPFQQIMRIAFQPIFETLN